MSAAIERSSEHLRIEAHPNGKMKTPLIVWGSDADMPLLPLDAVNLDTEKQRLEVINRLPEALREEAESLLNKVAVEIVRSRSLPLEDTTSTNAEVEPWDEPVAGADLLDSLAAFVGRFVYLPNSHVANAIALWVVATWFVADSYFAPILAVISATKRCGKSLLLDILNMVVQRGYLTSGKGVTPAVLFRLNERDHPTILIDEAEKLGGPDADKDLVGLLNLGYRRGATVSRCIERGGGQFDIVEFDAFGFRVLAAIQDLWDTVMDRAVVIRLERKPKAVEIERFAIRGVAPEGRELARRISRWVNDNRDAVVRAEATAFRPQWLNDRECDTWAILFAIASTTGGAWPELATKAAKSVQPDSSDEGDLGERLLHDVRTIIENENQPEVIKSSDLVKALNEIETSPWGDYRGGEGITAHRLAAKLRPFRVTPRQRRTRDGSKVRGYWYCDFEEVFKRYPSSLIESEVGQPGQPSNDGGCEGSQTGTESETCPASSGTGPHVLSQSKRGENPVKMGVVPLVPIERPRTEVPEKLIAEAREYMIGWPDCSREQAVAHLGTTVSPATAKAAVDEAWAQRAVGVET